MGRRQTTNLGRWKASEQRGALMTPTARGQKLGASLVEARDSLRVGQVDCSGAGGT